MRLSRSVSAPQVGPHLARCPTTVRSCDPPSQFLQAGTVHRCHRRHHCASHILIGRRPKYPHLHLSLFPRWRAHVHLPAPDVHPRHMAPQRQKFLPFALPRTPRSRYFSLAHSPILSSGELPAWQIVGFSSGGEPNGLTIVPLPCAAMLKPGQIAPMRVQP